MSHIKKELINLFLCALAAVIFGWATDLDLGKMVLCGLIYAAGTGWSYWDGIDRTVKIYTKPIK